MINIEVTARAGTKQKERPFPDQKAKAKTGQDLGPPTAADDKRSNVIPIRRTVQQRIFLSFRIVDG